MNLDIEYLLSYLQDELRDLPHIRIHPVAPATTQKSPDLPQDYDPNEHHVHLTRGVRVRVSSREYFFPAQWATQNVQAIQDQAREIRQFYETIQS